MTTTIKATLLSTFKHFLLMILMKICSNHKTVWFKVPTVGTAGTVYVYYKHKLMITFIILLYYENKLNVILLQSILNFDN